MAIPVMWKIKEASEKTGLSYSFIRKLCMEGKIVHVKSGNRYYINAEKLIAYLNGEECEKADIESEQQKTMCGV